MGFGPRVQRGPVTCSTSPFTRGVRRRGLTPDTRPTKHPLETPGLENPGVIRRRPPSAGSNGAPKAGRPRPGPFDRFSLPRQTPAGHVVRCGKDERATTGTRGRLGFDLGSPDARVFEPGEVLGVQGKECAGCFRFRATGGSKAGRRFGLWAFGVRLPRQASRAFLGVFAGARVWASGKTGWREAPGAPGPR